MSGAVPLLPPYVFMRYTGATLLLLFYVSLCYSPLLRTPLSQTEFLPTTLRKPGVTADVVLAGSLLQACFQLQNLKRRSKLCNEKLV